MIDVIIIGAGTMGLAAGYTAAKDGKSVVMIDADDPPHNSGSHHGDTRMIRLAYAEGAQYVPFVLRAKALWEELEHATGEEMYVKTGVLGAGKKDGTFVNQMIDSAREYNLPLDVLTAEEANARWKGLALPADYAGCYEPEAGVLYAEKALRVYRREALAAGAKLYTHTTVQSVEPSADFVTVVTDHGSCTGKHLIVSAGARSGAVLKQLGLRIPLQPIRKTFSWYEADEARYSAHVFPGFAMETADGTFYGFSSVDEAGIKLGRHDGGEAVDPEQQLAPFQAADSADTSAFLSRFLPLSGKFKHGKTCLYTMTPDGSFVIDRHPQFAHIAVAAGFSGHGFKFAPAVGEALVQLVEGSDTTMDLTSFTIGRFSDEG
ncbi:N-methyl-L-tryptophan oxidase [Alkalicoccus luteus]|uniref:N-methyl-L-tryptophan oxidase n=1 Tax=Alkalicoccus luteus TaxID=1237094 RepID=A0A969PQB8_9BACI|nr:N-methyl-L-tryptophan oxidase [Alkalicoccus luteus]NJP38450.1 N-methyl-L-tryptophan oxidase [Alkalicoccus luteus]